VPIVKAVKLCNIFFSLQLTYSDYFFSYCLPNSSQDLWKRVNTLSRLNRQIILIYYFLASSHLLPCSIPGLSFIVVSYTIFFLSNTFGPCIDMLSRKSLHPILSYFILSIWYCPCIIVVFILITNWRAYHINWVTYAFSYTIPMTGKVVSVSCSTFTGQTQITYYLKYVCIRKYYIYYLPVKKIDVFRLVSIYIW